MYANLTAADDKLYFTAYESLWKTDGTGKGTVLVKDLYASFRCI